MMIGELAPESSSRGRKRKRPPSPSQSQSPIPSPTVLSLPAVEGVKDVNICVRLETEGDQVEVGCKWLRLKIPAILLLNRSEFNPERSQDDNISEENRPRQEIKEEYISLCSGSGNSFEEMKVVNMRAPTWDEIFSDSRKQKPVPIFYDYILCELDPINGPFVVEPLVKTKSAYMSESSCTSIGSVIYALGNDITHVPQATQLFIEAWSMDNPLKPPPHLPSSSSSSSSSSIPILNTSHRLHFCDFSKQYPIWEISSAPLCSPRLFPKLVSLDGKLYAFGGNSLFDDNAPFAEVYDPRLEYWEPLPNPPFPKIPYRQLSLFPLPESHEILVIGCFPSLTSYTFNTLLSSWHPYNFPHLCQLLYAYRSIPYQPVIFGQTLYWIDIIGQLCVFNVESGRFYRGPISPLLDDHEDLLQFLEKFELCDSYTLIPISSSLLAILWTDPHFITLGIRCGTTLHITLVDITLHHPVKVRTDSDSDPDSGSSTSTDSGSNTDSESEHERRHSLAASVVTCVCFPLVREDVRVVDAFVIDDDTGCWQTMSSCSSYQNIADKA